MSRGRKVEPLFTETSQVKLMMLTDVGCVEPLCTYRSWNTSKTFQ